MYGSGFADPRPVLGVTVRRAKTGLSHRVSVEASCGACRGQGSQIQDRAVTQGVIDAFI